MSPSKQEKQRKITFTCYTTSDTNRWTVDFTVFARFLAHLLLLRLCGIHCYLKCQNSYITVHDALDPYSPVSQSYLPTYVPIIPTHPCPCHPCRLSQGCVSPDPRPVIPSLAPVITAHLIGAWGGMGVTGAEVAIA